MKIKKGKNFSKDILKRGKTINLNKRCPNYQDSATCNYNDCGKWGFEYE